MSQLRQDLFEKWRGLMNDNPVKGSLTKAINVTVEDNGAYLESRLATSTVLGPIDCPESRGFESVFELSKSNGDKFVILDAMSVSGSGATIRKVIGAENISTTNSLEFDSVSTVIPSVSIAGTPSYCTARDRAFRVDGNSENYTISALNDYSVVGVAAPVSITASNASGGSLLAGDYRVYVVDVKSDGAGYYHRSNPSTPVDVTVSGSAITVSVTETTSDPDVTHKWIYRTLYDGQYRNAFYVTAVANATANVTLTGADDTINTQTGIYIIDIEGGNSQLYGVPPKADFVLYAQDRVFYGVKSESRLYYSEIGFPESVGTTSYTTPFEAGDGDELVGGLAFQNSLLIFKNYKTFVTDLLAEDYPSTKISSRIGCIDPRTIKATGSTNSALWLSAEGVILYANGQIANVTTGKIFKTLIRPYILAGADFIAEYYPDRNQYHLMMFYRNAAETAIVDHKHLVFSLNSGEWTEFYDRESAGGGTYNQLASVAAGIVTDGKGKQAMVTASITFGGTTVDLKQWDIDSSDIYTLAYRIAQNIPGTICSYSTPNSEGTLYVISYEFSSGYDIYKITYDTTDGSGTLVSNIETDVETYFPASEYDSYYYHAQSLPGMNIGVDSDDGVWITVQRKDSVTDDQDFFLLKYTNDTVSSCTKITEAQFVDPTTISGFPTNFKYGSDINYYWYIEEWAHSGITSSSGYTYSCDGWGYNSTVMDLTSDAGYVVSIDMEGAISDAGFSGYYLWAPIGIYSDGTYDYVWFLCHEPLGELANYGMFIFKFFSSLRVDVIRSEMLTNYYSSLTMSWNDPEFHIQTAFDDFNAPHLKKTLQKIHLPIDATNGMCGLVHVQPDFTEQNYIGITDEAATNRYSTSPIVHEGTVDVDTNDVFTTDEQTRTEALGMNVSGKRLRLAIRGGSIGAVGRLKIYPPVFHVRYWGQNDRNKRG